MHQWFTRVRNLLDPTRSVRQIKRTAGQQRIVNEAAGHLVLNHFNSCPYCLRVRRAAFRLDVPVELRNIQTDPNAYRELVAGGGRQTVPCLHIDEPEQDKWLYESSDIIHYLSHRFAPNHCRV